MRHAFYTFGSTLSLISFFILISAEDEGPAVVRETARWLSLVAAGFMAALIVFAASRLRERADYQGRVNNSPFQAFADVWRNPHARLLIIVTFIENVGGELHDVQAKEEFARRRVALRRYADPEEVAHGTLSLVVPAACFITGVALPVDGGLTIRNA